MDNKIRVKHNIEDVLKEADLKGTGI